MGQQEQARENKASWLRLYVEITANTSTASTTFTNFGPFTHTEPPLPPIGRWTEDSFVFEDERGLLHYTRPVARLEASA